MCIAEALECFRKIVWQLPQVLGDFSIDMHPLVVCRDIDSLASSLICRLISHYSTEAHLLETSRYPLLCSVSMQEERARDR